VKRTITVPTLDHGDVTIAEPAWCTGENHTVPVRREDISHVGPIIDITVGTTNGPRPLLRAHLSQWPFALTAPGTVVHESVLIADDFHAYDVAGLDQLADDLLDAARRVCLIANRLAIENPLGGGR
jgi:hypothetical protein